MKSSWIQCISMAFPAYYGACIMIWTATSSLWSNGAVRCHKHSMKNGVSDKKEIHHQQTATSPARIISPNSWTPHQPQDKAIHECRSSDDHWWLSTGSILHTPCSLYSPCMAETDSILWSVIDTWIRERPFLSTSKRIHQWTSMRSIQIFHWSKDVYVRLHRTITNSVDDIIQHQVRGVWRTA